MVGIIFAQTDQARSRSRCDQGAPTPRGCGWIAAGALRGDRRSAESSHDVYARWGRAARQRRRAGAREPAWSWRAWPTIEGPNRCSLHPHIGSPSTPTGEAGVDACQPSCGPKLTAKLAPVLAIIGWITAIRRVVRRLRPIRRLQLAGRWVPPPLPRTSKRSVGCRGGDQRRRRAVATVVQRCGPRLPRRPFHPGPNCWLIKSYARR